MFMVMAGIIRVFLRETLHAAKRVKFRWRRSGNPLAFLTLFRRGPRLRLLALAHVWGKAMGAPRRRRDCHCADIPSPSILKHLLQGEEGAAE